MWAAPRVKFYRNEEQPISLDMGASHFYISSIEFHQSQHQAKSK